MYAVMTLVALTLFLWVVLCGRPIPMKNLIIRTRHPNPIGKQLNRLPVV
jgi:hypothetical protein